jgi:hypothetical protein
MPGFSAVASTPIAALPASATVPISVPVTGVYCTTAIGNVAIAISTKVLDSGGFLGFGPVAGSAISALVISGASSTTVRVAGVSCTLSLGNVVIAGLPITLPVTGVYCTAFLNSVIVITIPTISVVGVYAIAKVGNVNVRSYLPTRWSVIDTIGGHFPNWQQIST